MLQVQQQTMAWKWLMSQLKLVKDPVLRNVMLAEFRKRALNEWGFDPQTSRINTNKEPVVLDAWEQEFINDINEQKTFGIDTRTGKREKTLKEAKARMLNFIECGGCLKDIPENIRTKTIEDLYYQCLNEYGDQLMADADRLIGVKK